MTFLGGESCLSGGVFPRTHRNPGQYQRADDQQSGDKPQSGAKATGSITQNTDQQRADGGSDIADSVDDRQRQWWVAEASNHPAAANR